MRLIQGFFYQTQHQLGIAYDGDRGSYGVFTHPGIAPVLFGGALWKPEGSPSAGWEGALQDRFGESNLSQIEYGPDKLHFWKQYVQQQGDRVRSRIKYELKKAASNNTWHGTWGIPNHQTIGLCRCVIDDVDDELLRRDMAAMTL